MQFTCRAGKQATTLTPKRVGLEFSFQGSLICYWLILWHQNRTFTITLAKTRPFYSWTGDFCPTRNYCEVTQITILHCINLCVQVGYSIGSEGTALPDEMANDLDNELVPAIHNAVRSSNDWPTSMEFVFNIVEMLS